MSGPSEVRKFHPREPTGRQFSWGAIFSVDEQQEEPGELHDLMAIGWICLRTLSPETASTEITDYTEGSHTWSQTTSQSS